MKKITLPHSKGFTLIELLTVISIISVLTALLTVAFVSVSSRSKDSQRKSNLSQIRAALELYKADNDAYPATAALTTSITCNAAFTTGTSPNLTTYMAKYPCDPKSTTAVPVKYFYVSTGTAYSLGACLDNPADKNRYTGTAISGMGTCTSPTVLYVETNP